jgi:hypothetical protein
MEGWQYTELSDQLAVLQARLLTTVLPVTPCVQSMVIVEAPVCNGPHPSVRMKRKLDVNGQDVAMSDNKRPAFTE